MMPARDWLRRSSKKSVRLHGPNGHRHLLRAPGFRNQVRQLCDSGGLGRILQSLKKFSELGADLEETLVRSSDHPPHPFLRGGMDFHPCREMEMGRGNGLVSHGDHGFWSR